jgi:SAM-dependent methyltransferase
MPASLIDVPRPHAMYKAEMRARLRALQPKSLLDVGCGDGALLLELKDDGCARCTGLEVEPAGHAALRAQGIEAVTGFAEALPFATRSFDLVVFEYTAHHLGDLAKSLQEAARVARETVIVLDPWYDDSIASQRTARRYDEWCKSIDVHLGLIHNPCLSAAELIEPLGKAGAFRFETTHRLILSDMPFERLSSDAQRHLDRIEGDRRKFEAERNEILAMARADGITEDGALLLIGCRT